MMTDPTFDHEKLDVYRLALEYVASAFRMAKTLSGLHRHSRDQWLRAAQSIPLNIAEGNGKRSLKDRSRFFDISHGSALECAAIQDVLADKPLLLDEAQIGQNLRDFGNKMRAKQEQQHRKDADKNYHYN